MPPLLCLQKIFDVFLVLFPFEDFILLPLAGGFYLPGPKASRSFPAASVNEFLHAPPPRQGFPIALGETFQLFSNGTAPNTRFSCSLNTQVCFFLPLAGLRTKPKKGLGTFVGYITFDRGPPFRPPPPRLPPSYHFVLRCPRLRLTGSAFALLELVSER